MKPRERERIMQREADVWHGITNALHRIWERRLRRAAYARYMQSAEWQIVRAEVMRRARGRCAVCGAAAQSVHHKVYHADLFKTRAGECEALCADCHKRAHRGKRHVSK